ncbi:MAG TPA: hypothetical protein VGR08_10790 [Thermomicrobiales bacterium]|nr:hypothetical protein [Thermomicrobiales bacterium]
MASERNGTAMLVFATALVGLSIVAGGDVGRVLNGTSGIVWFGAAGLLIHAAHRTSSQRGLWWTVVGVTAVVAFVIRPSDMALAAIGFGGAGLVVGTLARNNELLWVKLVPALYLPFHIGTAVLRSFIRSLTGGEASIRSDPPPTAALVPLLMVVAALLGGYAAVVIKARRSGVRNRRMSSV